MTISMTAGFSLTGELISNEKIVCDKAVLIGTSTCYAGTFSYLPNASIQGSTSSSYGVYTASSKTGTRLSVIMAGDPSSIEARVDLNKGIIATQEPSTVYCYYNGHGPISHLISECLIEVPWCLTEGSSATIIARRKFSKPAKFCYAKINIEGGLPTATAPVVITNGVMTETCNVSTSGNNQSFSFSAPMVVTENQTVTVTSSNGHGMYDFSISLQDQ